MKCRYMGIDYFLDVLSSDEWYLFVFSAEKKEFESLWDFGYACAYQEHQWTWDFLRRQSEIYHHDAPEPYPWEKQWAGLHPNSIPVTDFFEKCASNASMLKDPLPLLPSEKSVKSAMTLDDEWNSVFVIAETEDSYVGYWWQTTV